MRLVETFEINRSFQDSFLPNWLSLSREVSEGMFRGLLLELQRKTTVGGIVA